MSTEPQGPTRRRRIFWRVFGVVMLANGGWQIFAGVGKVSELGPDPARQAVGLAALQLVLGAGLLITGIISLASKVPGSESAEE